MAAHLMQYIILEYLVILYHRSIGIFSDNTPTVAWANKLSAKKSRLAGRLLRALALRQQATKSAPAVTASIAGIANIEADNASRWFINRFNKKDKQLTNENNLLYFNKIHPLQIGSWREFRPSTGLISKLICELRGERSTLASWMRIPRKGGSIGSIGVDMQLVVESAHTWIGKEKTVSSSSQDMQLELGRGHMDLADKLAFRASQTRWAPSQRASKWEER